ncbi:MAG: tRNA 2-thiouridine(34) synthase MnmA [Desulfobacter sp.]|nr:tRNA 2-thiouridine(34) synthase MnmA [Desulfobacter sp.]WDP86461.1 MAG: tRNA 2-thiouridine(34) synthase MnmA [Desulfobacter sp.]
MSSPVVAVALSGGIDSLVSGFLIKKAYKEVFGIHFTTGYESMPVDTHAIESQLGFPIHILDLSSVFEKEVVSYFTSTYLSGKTPNPCLVCNQKIKFGALLSHALDLGADALATGHYARVHNGFSVTNMDETCPWLEKGVDLNKDQSYFLARLGCSQLAKSIFPLGSMDKPRVRKIAHDQGLVPVIPSESQDICFIREKNFAQFINDKQGISPLPGPVMDITGKQVGTHNGLHTFTIGQRRGINIPASEPYYVRGICMADNTLHVCFKKDLGQKEMEVDQIIWNHPRTETCHDLITKIRYAHKGAASVLTRTGQRGKVKFNTPQNAVTPGQAAVFYRDNRVLGAGIIQ